MGFSLDTLVIELNFIFNFFFFFCGDKSPFCGTTGTLCFGLRLTLPHGFQSQDGSIIPCTLLSLVSIDPQSQI